MTETYDLNGNLASVTEAGITTTYAWNARNQLTGISNPGFSASFTYDGFGRRTGKTIAGATTNFVYDGLNPVQEKSGSTVTANLLTGLGIDEFFTRTDGVGTRALLTDALGSTLALADNTGTLQTQYTYEPFGYTTQTGAASTNSYKYTGREDDGSGLLYYRARYYHPRLQRFISEDPIGFGGGANFYAYVGNNPVVRTDPIGLKCPCGEELTQINAIGPGNALKGDQLRDQADMVAKATGLPGRGDGPQDAFRHCYWSCRMTQDLGIILAKTIGDIHEECGDRRFMDYINNLVGRTYGMSGADCRIVCLGGIRKGPLQLSP